MDILHNLLQAHRALGLCQSPSQTQVWEEIRAFCLNTDHKHPAKTLLSFPPSYIALITQDASQGFDPFVEKALKDMPNIQQLSNSFYELDAKTLTLFKKSGLEYDRHISDETALNLWLGKDPVFGKDAWRKKFPRKNPAVAFWEKEGLVLPRQTLSSEGLEIFIHAIENFPDIITRKMYDKCIKSAYCDWRLLVALHMKNHKDYIPATLSPWSKVRGLRKFENWREFFKTKSTGHAQLAHTKSLQNGPDLKKLLTWNQMDIPQKPEELFTSP